MPGGQVLRCKRNTGVLRGFPYMELSDLRSACKKELPMPKPAMAQTIRGNFEGFTKREVEEAYEAREALRAAGNPSAGRFQEMVSHTNVSNCPVKPRAIANALAIFGPNRAEVRAKTVRKNRIGWRRMV